MIKNNLPVLLAQRRMKITELERATKLSRTTLIAFYYEKSKGVKFETLDRICKALNCGIGELVEYVAEDNAEQIN